LGSQKYRALGADASLSPEFVWDIRQIAVLSVLSGWVKTGTTFARKPR